VHVHIILLGAGYLIADTFTQLQTMAHRPDRSKAQLDTLQLCHHVFGVILMLPSIYFMNGMTNYAANMMWQEFSTIFVAFRYLLFFYGVKGGDLKQSLNSFMLFFTFIVTRSAFQIYCTVAIVTPMIYQIEFKETHKLAYELFGVAYFAGAWFNVYLNVNWSSLIIKQVARIFTRGAANAEKEFVDTRQKGHVQLAEIDPENRKH
jgi:hypothetical protein